MKGDLNRRYDVLRGGMKKWKKSESLKIKKVHNSKCRLVLVEGWKGGGGVLVWIFRFFPISIDW